MVVTKTTTDVIASTCDIFYGGVTLGHTQGAISITWSNSTFPVNVNDFGPNVPVNIFSLGVGASITVPLAQYSADVLAELLPLGTVVSGTSLYIGDTTGQSLLSEAKPLLVVPQNGSDEIFFPAAVVTDDFDTPFQLDAQSIIEATFTALVDPNDTTSSGSVSRVQPNSIY